MQIRAWPPALIPFAGGFLFSPAGRGLPGVFSFPPARPGLPGAFYSEPSARAIRRKFLSLLGRFQLAQRFIFASAPVWLDAALSLSLVRCGSPGASRFARYLRHP